jgi:hypothetical protein
VEVNKVELLLNYLPKVVAKLPSMSSHVEHGN